MKLEFTIDGLERIDIVIERDPFLGSFNLTANGVIHVVKSPMSLSTHFSLRLKKEYSVEVGAVQKHTVRIVHTRPLFLAGFRPQKYVVTVDGNLAAECEGY